MILFLKLHRGSHKPEAIRELGYLANAERKVLYELELLRRLSIINYSWAARRVRQMKDEKTIFVVIDKLVFRRSTTSAVWQPKNNLLQEEKSLSITCFQSQVAESFTQNEYLQHCSLHVMNSKGYAAVTTLSDSESGNLKRRRMCYSKIPAPSELSCTRGNRRKF